MERECRKFEMDIAAAAGGELDTPVAEHAASCPSCGKLRAAALAISEAAARDPAISEEVAVALARTAIRQGTTRRPPLWAMPLLSASATAAALILYFGLAAAPQVAGQDGGAEGSSVASSLAPSVPEASHLALPEGLQAINDVILDQDEEGRP